MRINLLAAATALLAVSTLAPVASALPPNADPGLVAGANHHTGDDGFKSDLGRAPHAGEEKLRMHEHFVALRDRLAKAHAPTPDLEARRLKLLLALDTYIANGVTPENDTLPWRTPVFIDHQGTICAVGYLIQESAGRDLAEKIAKTHRYSFIEDIAKDMPEVRDWVATSGFTLEELGQIAQPGYMGPDVLLWHGFQLAKKDSREEIPDGKYEVGGVIGHLTKRRMDGEWKHAGEEGQVLGAGKFENGAGEWTSFYPSGKTMATGRFAKNLPTGEWTFLFESGHVAARGSFTRGQRTGDWTFYYDDVKPTPIAMGSFDKGGNVVGKWRHYDAKGALLATSRDDTIPKSWHRKGQLFWSRAYRIDIAPAADGVTHRIHQGTIDGDTHRLDELATADGKERAYLMYDAGEWYDAGGHQLVQVDGGWRADDCHWRSAERSAASDGDLPALHGMLTDDPPRATGETVDSSDGKTAPACTQGKLVSKARAARLDKLAATMAHVRAVSPRELEKLALGDDRAAGDGDVDNNVEGPTKPNDLTNEIAANMVLDVEWPYVDERFERLYATLPGYSHNY